MHNFLKKHPVSKIVLVVWIVFASLYVLYGEYSRLRVYVAQSAYNRGVTDSVVELMKQSQQCKPIPVTASGQRVDLINVECLKAGESENEADE